MIGRFLELGISTGRILESIGYFEDLGFRQVETGDIWAHPYAVLSDGQLCLGLHEVSLPAPLMTFVKPDLAGDVNELRSRGIDISRVRTGDDDFNEIIFSGPDNHHVRMIEARTFSPPQFDDAQSVCGSFREITLPVRDLEVAKVFWQRLGFDELESSEDPHPHSWMRGNGLVIGLHQNADIDRLALSFQADDLNLRLEQLDVRGIASEPAGPPGVSMLLSPDGLPILLHGH